jgi:BT1 family
MKTTGLRLTSQADKLFESVKASNAETFLELEPLQRSSQLDASERMVGNKSYERLQADAEDSLPVDSPLQDDSHVDDDKLHEAIHVVDVSSSSSHPELDLFRLENLAIPACYWIVGTLQGLVRPLLNVYPLELGATEAQQTTLATIVTIPAAFKLIFGFVSDNLPLFGYRRKSYMLVGWWGATATTAFLIYSYELRRPVKVVKAVDEHNVTNATMNSEIDPMETNRYTSDSSPPLQVLSAVFFLFGCSMWIADVMADSIVAQKARLEPAQQRGSLQSSCYAARFLGLMTAAPLSTYLYTTYEYGPLYIIALLCILPSMVMTPLIYHLAEDCHVLIAATTHQCKEIWNTVCQRSVWQPMAFVYLYNILQVTNAAWRQFLSTVHGFTPANLNTLLVVSYVMLYVGTMFYKYCLLHTSWRRIYQACLVLNAVLSLLQVSLIRGWTFGLPVFVFALGDDAMAELLQGVQFLPLSVMMVALCPVGSEGASYAMFTTVW